MLTSKQMPVPTIPGFQFLACESSAAYSETWKACDPDHALWRIQFVHGFSDLSAEERADSLRRLRSYSHPVLVKADVLAEDGVRVVLGSRVVGTTLFQRFTRCREQGKPGIPRDELLGYLQVAAETMDTLFDRHNLQHLGLNPHVLLLDDADHLRIVDFGLAQLFWHRAGQCVALLNNRYAAPELFEREVTPCSDQYSLAVIFVEMLTGRNPLPRQRDWHKGQGVPSRPPDLGGFSPKEQKILEHALNTDPKHRFDCCKDLIEALAAVIVPVPGLDQERTVILPAVLARNGVAFHASTIAASGVVLDLLNRLAPHDTVTGAKNLRYVLEPGRRLYHHCPARWPTGLGRLKLRLFSEQWNAPVIRDDKECLTFFVPTEPTLWQHFTGQQPGLQVEVHLHPCPDSGGILMEVSVEITPQLCTRPQAVHLLAQVGPLLLEDLRALLYLAPERRTGDRVQFQEPLSIIPVQHDMQLGHAIACHGKDLSPSGIALILPQRPTTTRIYIQPPVSPDAGAIALLGDIVRLRPHEKGWFEAGARFSPTDVKALLPETEEPAKP